MNQKRALGFLSILLIVVMLAACVRSASTPPTVVTSPAEGAEEGNVQLEPGAESSKGQTMPTNEVLQQLELFVTQTAAAGGQAPGAQEPAAPAVEGTPSAQEAAPVESSSDSSAEQPAVESTAPAAPEAPPADVVAITATPGIPKSYTLQPGEFIYCIARRFDVNPLELLSINGLSTNSVVRGGMTLKIPQTGNSFPGERSLLAHPTTYSVQSGQNIYEIACEFGDISPDMIGLANGLEEPYTLTTGQVLNIP